jgi:hypothetical protein
VFWRPDPEELGAVEPHNASAALTEATSAVPASITQVGAETPQAPAEAMAKDTKRKAPSSKFRGVSKRGKKWQAQITVNVRKYRACA